MDPAASTPSPTPPPAPNARAAAGPVPAGLPLGPLTTAELAAAVPDARARRHYVRIWHGMYRREDQPDDLRLRSVTLARAWPEGVLRGRSAALLWGDDSVPPDALPEIWLPSTRKARPGRVYRYGSMPGAAVTELDGLRVTTPLRTCRDLAGDLPLEDAVVAVERLCAVVAELPAQLSGAAGHPSGRGGGSFAAVVRAARPRSCSAASTRARLELAAAGLAGFDHGHTFRLGHGTIDLPLADPVARCVVLTPEPPATPGRASPAGPAERHLPRLQRAGWTVIIVGGEDRRGPATPRGPATSWDPAALRVPAPSQDAGASAGSGGAGRRAAAVLRARWPGTRLVLPVWEDSTADPHGLWSGGTD